MLKIFHGTLCWKPLTKKNPDHQKAIINLLSVKFSINNFM